MRRLFALLALCFTLLIGVQKAEAHFKDSSKQFFSVSLGLMVPGYFLNDPDNGGSLEQPGLNSNSGVFFALNFNGRRMGLSLEPQVLSRNFKLAFPYIGNAQGTAYQHHKASLSNVLLRFNYRALDAVQVKCFAVCGLMYTWMTDVVVAESFEPYPLNRSKPEFNTYRLPSASAGLLAEINLYRQDIRLLARMDYVQPFESSLLSSMNSVRRITAGIGVSCMLQNILYKDKINTLKRYP